MVETHGGASPCFQFFVFNVVSRAFTDVYLCGWCHVYYVTVLCCCSEKQRKTPRWFSKRHQRVGGLGAAGGREETTHRLHVWCASLQPSRGNWLGLSFILPEGSLLLLLHMFKFITMLRLCCPGPSHALPAAAPRFCFSVFTNGASPLLHQSQSSVVALFFESLLSSVGLGFILIFPSS